MENVKYYTFHGNWLEINYDKSRFTRHSVYIDNKHISEVAYEKQVPIIPILLGVVTFLIGLIMLVTAYQDDQVTQILGGAIGAIGFIFTGLMILKIQKKITIHTDSGSHYYVPGLRKNQFGSFLEEITGYAPEIKSK